MREKFILPDGIYQLSHSVGCLPKIVADQQHQFFSLWGNQGGGAWDSWLEGIDQFRQGLARFLGGETADFCPQTNISSGIAKIISGLPERAQKKKILISELDFPSVGFVLQQAVRSGYEIVTVPDQDGRFSAEIWADYLQEDVQLALFTHVIYGNSFQNPIKELIQLARAKEIFSIVDVAQSVGVVPINVQEWDADFVVGSSIKWLCGGPGAGFLWSNEKSRPLFEPTDVGWFSHENPFEFQIHQFRYAADARRFWGGTPSVLPFFVAQASMQQMRQIGINQIAAHNQRLTTKLVAAAIEYQWPLVSSTKVAERGGTVCIAFPEAEKVVTQLAERDIWVDSRPAYGVRFSPHIYVSEDQMEETIEQIKQIVTG